MLGSSALALCIGALTASGAAPISANANVTIFNVSIFLASALIFLSIVTTPARTWYSEKRKKLTLISSYVGVTIFVLILTALATSDITPVFFTDQGSTDLRTFILAFSILFFLMSSIGFGYRFLQRRSPVLFWYSTGLVCSAIGLFGAAIVTQFNDLLNWVARLTQYAGGLYFLVAILRHNAGLGYEEGLSGSWVDAFGSDRKQFSDLFAKMLNGFAYCKILRDKSGKAIDFVFLEVNITFEKIFNLSRKQIIGKKVTEVLPGIEKDRADWIGVYGQVALIGIPVSFEDYSEATGKWFNVSAYSPKMDYFAVIFDDISNRKKIQEELSQSEERFRLIAEAANVMVYELNLESGFTTITRGFKELLGYTEDEVHISNDWWTNQIHPVDKAYAEAKLNEMVRAGTHGLLEYCIRNKQGDYIIVHDTAKVIRNETGKVFRLVGGVRDVTERKRAEEELRQAQVTLQKYTNDLEHLVEERTKQLRDAERLAVIGATAGMVGHDIRNPLQAIVGDVYLSKQDVANLSECEEKRDLHENLQAIEEHVAYINKIVLDLQDYARPLKPVIEEVKIISLIKAALQNKSVPRKIKTYYQVDDDAATLFTDVDLLKRILNNLAINAIQSMPNGGKVSVVVKKKNENTIIAIEDTGIGISDDVKPKLFTPMFTTKSKGQGFGLAVVKRLTEALGGTITFESQVGKGTKFIVILPAQQH